jgi:hypothetical protein
MAPREGGVLLVKNERSHAMSRLHLRWSLPILVLAVLLVVPAGVTAQAGTPIGATPAAAGALVNVGGRQMFINCQGTGSPTVIL